MPTLYRIGVISIRMYADDHRPPHVHLVSPDFEVLVGLSDGAIIAGMAQRAEIRRALEWVAAHRDGLMLQWKALNERG
jgi:hypothetical protein